MPLYSERTTTALRIAYLATILVKGRRTQAYTRPRGRTNTPPKPKQNALEVGQPGAAVAGDESGGGGGRTGDSSPACLLDKVGPEDLVLDLSDTAKWEHWSNASRIVGPGQKGLYVLLYCGCPMEGQGEAAAAGARVGGLPAEAEHRVAFKLRVAFWNEGAEGEKDYLSAGRESLPKLFLGTFALFFGALVVWAHCIRRNARQASDWLGLFSPGR